MMTPGPWHFNKHQGRQHEVRLIYGPDGYLIADAGRISKRTEGEMDANARLIASSPQMLGVLKRCRDFLAEIALDENFHLFISGSENADVLIAAIAAIEQSLDAED